MAFGIGITLRQSSLAVRVFPFSLVRERGTPPRRRNSPWTAHQPHEGEGAMWWSEGGLGGKLRATRKRVVVAGGIERRKTTHEAQPGGERSGNPEHLGAALARSQINSH